MSWREITIAEVPGGSTSSVLKNVDPADRDKYARGFVHELDAETAGAWILEAYQRTRPEVEIALDRSGWKAQYQGVKDAVSALSKAVKAMNLRWQYIPALTNIWVSEYGGFFPDAPICGTKLSGPNGFFGYGRQLLRARDLWQRIKGDARITIKSFPIYKDPAEAAAYQACRVRLARANETGSSDAPVCNEPLIEHYRQVKEWDAVLVLPAYLTYTDDGVVLNTSIENPSSVPSQRFDGVFVGAGCHVPPTVVAQPAQPGDRTPSNVTPVVSGTRVGRSGLTLSDALPDKLRVLGAMGPVPDTYDPVEGTASEVSRNTSSWTWNCFRWDDAPFNQIRFLPPLRWSFQVLRRMAEALYELGPENTVRETRTWAVLENINRAIKYGLTTDQVAVSYQTEIEKQLKADRDAAKDVAFARKIADGSCAVAGGVGLAAGGFGGLVGPLCAIAVAAIFGIGDLFKGITARGCDLDLWGEPIPSGVEPRITISGATKDAKLQVGLPVGGLKPIPMHWAAKSGPIAIPPDAELKITPPDTDGEKEIKLPSNGSPPVRTSTNPIATMALVGALGVGAWMLLGGTR